jgi:hypothetical protein
MAFRIEAAVLGTLAAEAEWTDHVTHARDERIRDNPTTDKADEDQRNPCKIHTTETAENWYARLFEFVFRV